jgi:hypothetical protein
MSQRARNDIQQKKGGSLYQREAGGEIWMRFITRLVQRHYILTICPPSSLEPYVRDPREIWIENAIATVVGISLLMIFLYFTFRPYFH